MASGRIPALAITVELAQLGDALTPTALSQLLAVAHVGLDRYAAPARLLDDRLVSMRSSQLAMGIRVGLDVLAYVDSDDVRALSGLKRRVSSSLTAAGARDERDLALHASRQRSS